MYRHKKVLNIHHHPQQPVNLILRHILQVGNMISCKQSIKLNILRLSTNIYAVKHGVKVP